MAQARAHQVAGIERDREAQSQAARDPQQGEEINNLDDARRPDNAGNSPVDAPIVADGPAAYYTFLGRARNYA